MNLSVKQNAILHVTFDSQKELAMTMARVQEFYECNGLRGKAFDFEAFVDFYTANVLNIGALETGAFSLNGWVRRIAYYPTRLPNATLQALTA